MFGGDVSAVFMMRCTEHLLVQVGFVGKHYVGQTAVHEERQTGGNKTPLNNKIVRNEIVIRIGPE